LAQIRIQFTQVNEMDGFFLTGRKPDPAFTWDELEAPGACPAGRG
jgi:NitT/TauT family transport system substrate-binding protein